MPCRCASNAACWRVYNLDDMKSPTTSFLIAFGPLLIAIWVMLFCINNNLVAVNRLLATLIKIEERPR
jgi:hypothetical protein